MGMRSSPRRLLSQYIPSSVCDWDNNPFSSCSDQLSSDQKCWNHSTSQKGLGHSNTSWVCCFQNSSFTLIQSSMSKARSRQNRSRSSPPSMRHWCSICEGWLTKHPLHSIVMASLTTSLTAKTIARTNCTCICVMVKWACSLSAAAYIESLRRFQNVCRSGLNFIYGYWGETQWLITTLCRCGLVFVGNESSTNVCQKNIKHELYHLAAVLRNVTARSLILHLNTFYSENYWDTVLRLLPWWVWECLFCGIYASEKFYHNTHTLYGPSYASVNTSCHKILDHIVHRETLFLLLAFMSVFVLDMCSSRHLVNNWISIVRSKYLYFNSIRHSDVEICPTCPACVAHKYQDIVFQTQETIPTLIHDIVLALGQGAVYKHFDSHKTTLLCDLH